MRSDQDLAIGILGGIKSKTAGKILGNMDKDQAARLSKDYANLGRTE
jgi:flagellar motility protein MotE (MotC chaperone)